jgi:hypothetical protein
MEPRIGYWLSERKSKKFNLDEFHDSCSKAGLKLVKVSYEHGGESVRILIRNL